MLEVIMEDVDRHPGSTPLDVRKLVSQCVFGMDHLLADQTRFVLALRSEWIALGDPPPREAAIQMIDPCHHTARVHLAPCRHHGVKLDDLSRFLVSQPCRHGEKERFDRLWTVVISLADEELIPFSPASLASLAASTGTPHHSLSYGKTAYRVIHDIAGAEAKRWLKAAGI